MFLDRLVNKFVKQTENNDMFHTSLSEHLLSSNSEAIRFLFYAKLLGIIRV